jgi:YD repeat-containing protein
LDTVTYGSGKVITYSPDAFGRPTQAAPYVTAVSHHPGGAISSMSYANGVKTDIGLNERQWPSTLKIAKGSAVFDKTYYYDRIGNVTTILDAADNSRRDMTYDDIDRLVSATGPWTGLYKASYDGRGNIQRQALTNGTAEYFSRAYTYDPNSDKLLNVSETNGATTTPYDYNYDVYGNVTGKGAIAFAYNDASNMRCSNCGKPNEALYDYDGGNMRVRLTKGGVATYFVYGLGGKLLWEQVPGVSLKEYFYVGGKQIATREKALSAP